MVLSVRDQRPFAVIPTRAVNQALFLGGLFRSRSHSQISARSQRRGWQCLMDYPHPLDHEELGYVAEHYRLEDWRHILVYTAKKLKTNKALDSCKIDGLLFVSLDANEHFASRACCCDQCCARQIKIRDEHGQEQEVTEYYHRYVFAQINGPKLNLLLDLEPIRPAEEERQAALRLLGRLRRNYGPRFFDGITVDAWYSKGPFLSAVQKLGWGVVTVLKGKYEVMGESQRLIEGKSPDLAFKHDDRQKRQVQLWKVDDLDFTDSYSGKISVVTSQEQWEKACYRGGKKCRKQLSSQWIWGVTEEFAGYGAKTIWRVGHRRWGIENKAFRELTQEYHLEHCFHHHPVAMLAQMLILMLAFNMFNAYAILQDPLWREGKTTLCALTEKMLLHLELHFLGVPVPLDSG
jgi:Transposase DDE domain